MTNDIELLKTLTVLYVEDELLLRKLFGRFMKRRFAAVYEAENGREGLEIYKTNKDDISIVITDIEMPVMDGLMMIDKILEIQDYQPIIITTGYNDERHTSKKACMHIIKPIDERKLLESIMFCVGKRSDCSNLH
ncbi:MAG: response regulator [Nitrospirae bacterium]|nr:response regulator [Nitrospirota bacterium]